MIVLFLVGVDPVFLKEHFHDNFFPKLHAYKSMKNFKTYSLGILLRLGVISFDCILFECYLNILVKISNI